MRAKVLIGLVACSFCLWAPMSVPAYATSAGNGTLPKSERAIKCENDSDADLRGLSFEHIGKARVALVPLNLRTEALDFLDGAKVVALSVAQAIHFSHRPAEPNLKPYLVRTCMFIVGLDPKWRDQLDKATYERLVSGSFFPDYVPDKQVLIANSGNPTLPDAKAWSVVFVIWNDKPIRDVRINALKGG